MKMNARISTISILTFLFLIASSSVFGQGYRKGEISIAPGFGAGSVSSYLNYYSLPVIANLEVGFSDIISGGGFVGFRIWGCNGCNTQLNPVLGIRASGHLFPILREFGVDVDVPEKADVYLTILSGYEVDNNNLSPNDFIWPRPVIGGKWYFVDAFGAWAEVGYGAVAYANIGLVFRFGGARN